ncbi:hypothetical protein FACS189426_19510 [Bacteroidia bacterium]|nr:hypothetical protein FACS189426_19510 [Bacteroidia bacterium]GHT84260.1 hypothetical protein FACS18947_1470 [Bacteroidia bacterium]
MKKIFILLFTAALMVSFAACNGAKKEAAPAEIIESEVVEEVVLPETPAVQLTPAEVLKDFQAFVKEYAEAYNNVAKDPQKFQTLAGQLKQKLTDIESIASSFNAKQTKEYQKARELVIQVNKRGK